MQYVIEAILQAISVMRSCLSLDLSQFSQMNCIRRQEVGFCVLTAFGEDALRSYGVV